MNLTKEDERIVNESKKLIRNFQVNDNLKVNCFGSVALAMACPKCAKIWKDNNRSEINDLDLITYKNDFRNIKKILIGIGYELDANTSLTQNRQDYLYSSELIESCRVEVFGNPITHFHHPIKLVYNELSHVGINDLFLTKIQWSPSKLSKKQKIDIVIILDEIIANGTSKEFKNYLIIQSKSNWKLGFTIKENVKSLIVFLEDIVISDDSKQNIIRLLNEILNHIDNIEYTFYQRISIWFYKRFITKDLTELGKYVEYINNNEKE